MIVAEQIGIMQKWAGEYGEAEAARFLITLNSVYLEKTNAWPQIVLQATSTVNTVSGTRDTPFGVDVGRIKRAWLTSGAGGYNGRGTVGVWDRDRLVETFPQFHVNTGAPTNLAPWSYNEAGSLLVNFNAIPDDAYELGFDYSKKVTKIADTAGEMAVDQALQELIALEASRRHCPADSSSFAALTQILQGSEYSQMVGQEQTGNASQAWKTDKVHNARRNGAYYKMAGY